MNTFKYKAIHLPTGAVHRKKGDFANELEFHRTIQEYNRQSYIQARRLDENRIWAYISDGDL